jgi:hypothetical protein
MSTPFWAGGPEAYATGLERHYAKLLRTLRERREACRDDAERKAIEKELATIEAEHNQRLRDIPGLLF